MTERNSFDAAFFTPDRKRGSGHLLRDYLTGSCGAMTLAWRLDSSGGRIITEFKWNHEDPRSARDLVKLLANSRPVSADSLLQGKVPKTDPWREAFDGLVSKPENFSKAWKVRFLNDVDRMTLFDTPSVINLFAGMVHDRKGGNHLLIVNDLPILFFPGAGQICYYVFDISGRYQAGGIVYSGHRCASSSCWIDKTATRLTLRSWFNDQLPVDTEFILDEAGLVLDKSSEEIGRQYQVGQALYHDVVGTL